jgi:histidyl-tRNA synthetase
MAKVAASIPQGTRDFGPDVVRKRNYIFRTIREVFELYGFQPLETPAMENLETLMGKYGEEGDKLIFRVLNNGLTDPNHAAKARVAFENVLNGKNDKDLTQRALKYDLTIPFARYVAMNHGQLSFPFKRYQIQPVWRADRPAKGRYREFYQCDADVVGSKSLLNEIELVQLYADVFTRLRLGVDIKINNRKVLAALAERCGAPELLTAITTAIDKLDKIGLDQVKEELKQRGINDEQITIIADYLRISGDNAEQLAQLRNLLGDIPGGAEGIGELERVTSQANPAAPCRLIIDPTLARGLNYYTGCILEVKARDAQMGSIGGGGRYDDLTGLFGVPNIPGVGISFGVDRIYDVMEELKLFPDDVHTGTQVLFFNLGENESRQAWTLMQQLRANGVKSELYHETTKFDKQFKYAEKKQIPYIIIIGDKELDSATAQVKDLRSGQQSPVPFGDLAKFSFI